MPVADLSELSASVGRLEGRRDELSGRVEELSTSIALAKARLAQRPDLEALLEEAQAEAHQKSIGDYSAFLTAVIQEIFTQKIQVKVELGMERGLPSLEIFLEANGKRANILEQASGSMTNAICMGLRFISTACSGMRQFLVLDEPDCWMRDDDKILVFFQALQEMTEKSGMQVLLVTHRNLGSVARTANIIELTGHALIPGGLKPVRRPGAREFKDDEAGVRSIHYRGFASFDDATLVLSPGLNIIFGGNDIGKSRTVRGLRSLFYGEFDDGDIRTLDGHKACEVECVLEGGRTVGFSRQPGRTPVNEWKLETPEGRRTEGGKSPPDWLPRESGIGRAEGLDFQIAHQKFPMFMVGGNVSGPQAAALLSIGNESAILRDMIRMAKDEKVRDAATARNGEAELATVRHRLAALEQVTVARHKVAVAEAAKREADAATRLASESADMLGTLLALDDAERHQALAVAATASLPDAEPDLARLLAGIADANRIGLRHAGACKAQDASAALLAATERLPGAEPHMTDTRDAERLIQVVENASSAEHKASAIMAAAALPENDPEIPLTAPAEAAIGAVERCIAGEAAAAAAETEALARETQSAVAMSDLLDELGNTCPLCGTHGIDHEHVLSAGGSV